MLFMFCRVFCNTVSYIGALFSQRADKLAGYYRDHSRIEVLDRKPFGSGLAKRPIIFLSNKIDSYRSETDTIRNRGLGSGHY